ncbi:MAG: C-GCAxxG-C-C family protein [Clostridiales bacterium]|nr:C-GCAxxG-C-C family protein [Clostridiales bacterium]
MDGRAEKAAELKRKGKCNCAQAIACTYCDLAGMDEQTLSYIAQAFGFGMGTLEGTCGSIIGAGIALGLHNKDRNKTVRDMRAIMTEFKARNGSVTCKTLKGTETGVVLRECPDCVKDAAEMLERILADDETASDGQT